MTFFFNLSPTTPMSDYINNYTLCGAALGFATFLIGTTQVGDIYFRKNSDGETHFTLANLVEFLRAPLTPDITKFRTAWTLVRGVSRWDRMRMLQLNWIFMIFLGAALGHFTSSQISTVGTILRTMLLSCS